jgi:Na+-driven multidrug efflux pump
VPLVLSIVYVHALRGAGDTRWPLLMTCLGVLGVRLPVSYLLGVVLGGGLVGAWIGMCADILLRALLATARFTFGDWVKVRV